jgi:RimJ/RimL family protein N-acetyltransferase
MNNVLLIRLAPEMEEAINGDCQYQRALADGNWLQLARVIHQHTGQILAATPAGVDQLHWGGYIAVAAETGEVVGSCAFKTAPTEEKAVEIAYFTYPRYEGRGYATAMAKKLINLAQNAATVERVVAHTLPAKSASTRVLEKVGMRLAGQVSDPEDGPVWRWQLKCASHCT